jgi:hypothetical protein
MRNVKVWRAVPEVVLFVSPLVYLVVTAPWWGVAWVAAFVTLGLSRTRED